MHKRLVNHCTIELSLIPAGPILIKAGKEGADPSKPDMEFVETYYQGGKAIYLPGSSLKGALRAHAERIVRTVGSATKPNNERTTLWASDPLKRDEYKELEKLQKGTEIYKKSSFTDQMFGNIAIASRVRIEDAYPVDPTKLKLEERNGVAIDRVFGSVAVGPFNYQVCTGGEFKTRIHLKNFSLAQLALIALVLRDLDDGWFGIGFAKSRGMGQVSVEYKQAVVQYPGCVMQDNQIRFLGGSQLWPNNSLLGAGMFLSDAERELYGFPAQDSTQVAVGADAMELGFGVQLAWEGEQVKNLFIRAVEIWRRVLEGVA